MLDVLYGLVVYPEFNVKVTNLSVGLNSAETFHLNLPFSHLSPKSATFSNSGVHVRADTEEAVIMSRAPEVARATTPSLNERIALFLCYLVADNLVKQQTRH